MQEGRRRKSETGAALAAVLRFWPDKVYPNGAGCQPVGVEQRRALAGGCSQADSAFPVLSGPGVPERQERGRSRDREREGGRRLPTTSTR